MFDAETEVHRADDGRRYHAIGDNGRRCHDGRRRHHIGGTPSPRERRIGKRRCIIHRGANDLVAHA
jgi:hypothetical protein